MFLYLTVYEGGTQILTPGGSNSKQTACRLVKTSIQSYIKPIREGVIKSSLICMFLIHYYQSFIMIGLTYGNFMILTNQKAF